MHMIPYLDTKQHWLTINVQYGSDFNTCPKFVFGCPTWSHFVFRTRWINELGSCIT
jgi:hypothetical protein